MSTNAPAPKTSQPAAPKGQGAKPAPRQSGPILPGQGAKPAPQNKK